jgi:hypothetical protein
MDVTTWIQLSVVLAEAVAEAMNKEHLGKDVKEEVQKHIKSDVYAVYHPIDYQTTGEFYESVVSTNPVVNGNNVEMSVEHDTNLMTTSDPWYHESVIDSSDFRDALPETIEEGKTHDLWGHAGATYLEPRPYMENTHKELEETQTHVTQLIKHLRSMGLNASKG